MGRPATRSNGAGALPVDRGGGVVLLTASMLAPQLQSSGPITAAVLMGGLLALCPGLLQAEPSAKAFAPVQATENKRVLILGDSLAAGYGLDPSESFPALLQEKIDHKGWPHRVINAGVSGDTSAGGLRRLNWLLKQPVDILVLELGANDGLRGVPPQTTQANLQAIIDRAREKYPPIQIVIAGMQMPPNMGAEYLARFERIFPELAAVNQAALIPFLLEGVGGRPELNQPDRVHPTAEGQRIMAENVWRVLRPLLEPGSSANGLQSAGEASAPQAR